MADDNSGRRAGTSTEALIRDALGEALPPDLLAGVAALAALIDARLGGREARPAPEDGAALAALLQRLAGRQIAAGEAVIAIGGESQLGDITISDVAGGNVIRLSIIGSQHVGAPQASADEAMRLEAYRLEAQERVRRQAERYDADVALLRRLSVAVYQLRATLQDLRALGEQVMAEDLAGYERAFAEARALMFESRAFLATEFSTITHDILALHTSLAISIRLLLRQSPPIFDRAELMELIGTSYDQNDDLFRQFIAAIHAKIRDSSPSHQES